MTVKAKQPILVYVTPDERKRLQVLADAHGRALSQEARHVIREYLRTLPGQTRA